MTRRHTIIAILALLALALAFQGTRGLWEPDEGRYTGIALRMLSSGDFINPAFNAEQPHFAKPPLTYWAVAAGISLLGSNEWGARLAHALAFVATTLLVYLLGRSIVPARPWLPALVYATFLLPFAASNAVTPDTLLALFETLAVAGFVRSRGAPTAGRRQAALAVMWLGFGLAFLTKGPPGLLPLLAIVCFCALEGGWRGVSRLGSVAGLLLFAFVGLGWFALVVATTPGLGAYFVHDEFVNRIFTGVHRRNSAWYGAFAVYVPTLLLGTLPWSWVALRAAARAPRALLSREWWRSRLREDPWTAFLALWFLIPLAVFMASRSRLPLYVLPLFPVLALLVARALQSWRPSRLTAGLLAGWLVALIAARAFVAHYPTDYDSRRLARTILEREAQVPEEVIFIDTQPHWGIGLYLGCEVEGVRLTESAPRVFARQETLADELSTTSVPRPLLVAQSERRGEIEAELARLNYQSRSLGTAGRWALIVASAKTEGPPHEGQGRLPNENLIDFKGF